MLQYSIFAEMEQRLLDMAALTQKLQQAPGSFSEAVVGYLKTLLDFAQAQRLYIASDVALTLDKVLTGKSDRAIVAGTARHNARKERDAFTAECLEALHGVLKAFLDKDARTFIECGDIWRQVLSRALAKGYNFENTPSSERVEQVFAVLKKDEEFLPYFAHVIGLTGIYNAKAILDITLPQVGL